MARYFFELHKGSEVVPDTYGSVCLDDEAALSYAFKALARCLAEMPSAVSWQHAEISVQREDKVTIGVVSITAEVERENPTTRAILDRIAEQKPLLDGS